MTGTITKRPQKNGSVSWGFYFLAGHDASGKRVQITKSGFATKREAADALRQAITEHQAGSAAPAQDRTFAKFFDEWIRNDAGRRCAPKTLERYTELGAYAVRKFGSLPLQKVTPMVVQIALNELQDSGGRKTSEHPAGRPLAPKTVREIAFLIHNCFETAVAWRLVRENPTNALRKKLPKAVKIEPIVLDRERLNTLLEAAAGTRLFALLVLAAATGCRRGELLALQWLDIDFDSGILNITKSLEETKAGVRVKSTKSGKPRRFAIPAGALEVLREHQTQQEHDRELFGPDYEDRALVFCRPEGGYYKPDKVSVRVTELARKAGLPGVGLHSLRHSHASELLSKGTPIPTVAKRLGHANANVTLSIYSHALEADELAAAKIWNDTMADVIDANRNSRAKRNLAKSSAEATEKAVSNRKQTA